MVRISRDCKTLSLAEVKAFDEVHEFVDGFVLGEVSRLQLLSSSDFASGRQSFKNGTTHKAPKSWNVKRRYYFAAGFLFEEAYSEILRRGGGR